MHLDSLALCIILMLKSLVGTTTCTERSKVGEEWNLKVEKELAPLLNSPTFFTMRKYLFENIFLLDLCSWDNSGNCPGSSFCRSSTSVENTHHAAEIDLKMLNLCIDQVPYKTMLLTLVTRLATHVSVWPAHCFFLRKFSREKKRSCLILGMSQVSLVSRLDISHPMRDESTTWNNFPMVIRLNTC